MTHDEQTEFKQVLDLIRTNEIGRFSHIDTPFGPRLISYADLTASGRYLRFIEKWVSRIRPYYANTHTDISSTGRLLTDLREQARSLIRRGVGAGDEDEVVFAGAGATGAVNKLVGLLGLRLSEPLDRVYALGRAIPDEQRPVVFIGPYEHHSNLLPWIESVAEVVEIGLDGAGRPDLGELEARLPEYSERPMKIGSFSAASNVTGVLSDVPAIARLLHGHGALAFFDFAAAAPYAPINMHPDDPDERIDALFISTHKFIGGPEGSGILVAHRDLFHTGPPDCPGGGTVDYVSEANTASIDYVDPLAEREEGGTPDIMGDLRTGAAFLVREKLGPDRVLLHEIDLAASSIKRLSAHPRIRVLGPAESPRLAIISLIIEDLHHDLVAALLDQLFGIQNRAGCACAGPYGHSLLDIDQQTSQRYRELIRRGLNGLKPGWVRLSLPYYATETDIDFLLSAVEFVADHGMDFVPLYRLGWRDGVWEHMENSRPAIPWIRLDAAALEQAANDPAPDEGEVELTEDHLRAERVRYADEARELASSLRERWRRESLEWNRSTGDSEVDSLVWFRFVHTDRFPG